MKICWILKLLMHTILKYKALIGKNISDVITYKNVQSRIIKNYDDIKWNSDEFDGIIVGHITELSAVCKRNLMEEIIMKCIAYKKKNICVR